MANNNNAGFLGAISTNLFVNNNNNAPNNNSNAPNNNDPLDEQLDDLLFTAEMIIDQFDQSGNANYQDVSDVLHDLGVHPRIDQRIENDPSANQILTRLQEIQNQLAGEVFGVAVGANGVPHMGPPLAIAGLPAGAAMNIYSPIPNVGRRTLPRGSKNFLLNTNIATNNDMVNFQGESGYGRYYKKSSFNSIVKNAQGRKKNPMTRAFIGPGNVVTYKANIAEEGGRRKYKKTRKARKSRKTRRANTRK